MHFSALLTAAAATAVLASPVEERAAANLPSCHFSEAPTNKEWRIINVQDQDYNTNCGRGVLDNARGACGNIESWECYYTDAKEGIAHISFRSPKGCRPADIASAISASRYGNVPQGFACTDSTHDQSVNRQGWAPPVPTVIPGSRYIPYDPHNAHSGGRWPPARPM